MASLKKESLSCLRIASFGNHLVAVKKFGSEGENSMLPPILWRTTFADNETCRCHLTGQQTRAKTAQFAASGALNGSQLAKAPLLLVHFAEHYTRAGIEVQ